MSLYKLFLSVACMAVGYASAMQHDKRIIPFQKNNIVKFSHDQWADQKQVKPAAFVQLIDRNGSIPKQTLGKMPIAHSRCLVRKNPKALENCCKDDNKNQLLDSVEVMHAAPEDWLAIFLPYLDLKSKQAKEKFESQPVQTSLESYSMAERLHIGMLKKYTKEQLFINMSRNELKVADDLNNRFADGSTTSIEVYRPTYDRIAALPKRLRQQFRNKEEFFTVKLMPSTTDQIIDIAANTAIGAIHGAGATAILSLGMDYGVDKFTKPAAKEFGLVATKMIGKSLRDGILSGDMYQSGVDSMCKVGIKESNNISCDFLNDDSCIGDYTVVKEFFNGVLTNVDQRFKDEFTVEKYKPFVIKHIKQGGSPMTETDVAKALQNSVGRAKYGAIVGGAAGFAYGVSTMNQPIVEKSISKL